MRPDVNSRSYKDTLEQYVEQQEVSRTGPPSQVRASMPSMNKGPYATGEVSEKVIGDFYGDDGSLPPMNMTGGRSRVGASMNANPTFQSQPQMRPPVITRRLAGQKKAVDDQTVFMKQAINNNILLKRDADTFYGEGNTENPANFVRNYNEFYRGTTPDQNTRKVLEKRDGGQIKEESYKNNKLKDVYHYNFITHKPKYVYTTEEKRLQKHVKHYDKFANDPVFKKAVGNFFAVENEFPKPDFTKRGPVTKAEQITSINRVYGGQVPFHL